MKGDSLKEYPVYIVPSKNTIKSYAENGIYHIYNRGVEKREIFTTDQDYSVFLSYLKEYLTPKDTESLQSVLTDLTSSSSQKADALKLLRMNNFYQEIDLLAYCLMPNHFHFLLKQNSSWGIEKFMRSLCTRYVQYFNKCHGGRVGSLFQDVFKAVLINSEEQVLHLSRYIHLNPHQKGVSLKEASQPNSYRNYLKLTNQEWVKPNLVLSYFSNSGFTSYKNFVESSQFEEMMAITVRDVSIDYV